MKSKLLSTMGFLTGLILLQSNIVFAGGEGFSKYEGQLVYSAYAAVDNSTGKVWIKSSDSVYDRGAAIQVCKRANAHLPDGDELIVAVNNGLISAFESMTNDKISKIVVKDKPSVSMMQSLKDLGHNVDLLLGAPGEIMNLRDSSIQTRMRFSVSDNKFIEVANFSSEETNFCVKD